MIRLADRLANGRVGFALKRVITTFELRLLSYYKRNPLESSALDRVRQCYETQSSFWSVLLRGDAPVLFSPGELLNLYHIGRLLRNHGGAFAEVGAFRGDSAEIICRAKGNLPFYVFEAFDGLPADASGDARFTAGMFASSEILLRRRLESQPNTTVIAGYFPGTASIVGVQTFSFVHLDVDLYSATKEALHFFYPRMLPGGRIVSHDYSQCEGVWRAVDEFLADKPEVAEPLGLTQVMIVKRS